MKNGLILETEETLEFFYLQGLREHDKYKSVIHFLDDLVKEPKKCDVVIQFLWADIQVGNSSHTLDPSDYKILYEDYDEIGYEIDMSSLNRDQEELERNHEKASEELARKETALEKVGLSRTQIDQFKTQPEDLTQFINDIRAEAKYLEFLEKKKLVNNTPVVDHERLEPVVRSKGMSM